MGWRYNEDKTMVFDGAAWVPLNVPTGESRRVMDAIAAGVAPDDYVAPASVIQEKTYTTAQLVKILIARGIVPKPNGE